MDAALHCLYIWLVDHVYAAMFGDNGVKTLERILPR